MKDVIIYVMFRKISGSLVVLYALLIPLEGTSVRCARDLSYA